MPRRARCPWRRRSARSRTARCGSRRWRTPRRPPPSAAASPSPRRAPSSGTPGAASGRSRTARCSPAHIAARSPAAHGPSRGSSTRQRRADAHRAVELAVVVLGLPVLAAGLVGRHEEGRVVDDRRRGKALFQRRRVNERLESDPGCRWAWVTWLNLLRSKSKPPINEKMAPSLGRIEMNADSA